MIPGSSPGQARWLGPRELAKAGFATLLVATALHVFDRVSLGLAARALGLLP